MADEVKYKEKAWTPTAVEFQDDKIHTLLLLLPLFLNLIL
jgi:hypothetical protein